MCLCVAFAHAFTVLSGMQVLEGTPNGVKFDITKPDKITKIVIFSQTRISMYTH